MGNDLGTQSKGNTNTGFKKQPYSGSSESSDSDDNAYGYGSSSYTPFYGNSGRDTAQSFSRQGIHQRVTPAPQYAPGEEPWRSKIQKPYDTKKDKQRLGRLVGGSLTVTEEEKKKLDAQKRKQRKR